VRRSGGGGREGRRGGGAQGQALVLGPGTLVGVCRWIICAVGIGEQALMRMGVSLCFRFLQVLRD
jgi:hypothetical protein